MKRLHEQRAPRQYRNARQKRRAELLFMLLATAVACAIVYAFAALTYAATHPATIGQDIGGGIHTTCHGTDRIYASSTGLAVIHDDTSCDSGG